MSTNRLYHTWLAQIRQLLPQERITRLRIFAWFATGLCLCRSVYLSRIASRIPGATLRASKTRRLRRFLDNPAVRVRPWYQPVARSLLAGLAAQGLAIRLIVDGTRVGFGHQLLMVTVAHRRRALPVAWTWVKSRRGHSSVAKQQALLKYVKALIPPGAEVLIVGDSEFGDVTLLRQLEEWGWHYVMRQQGRFLVQVAGEDWQPLGALVPHRGQKRWVAGGLLTAKYAYPVNLLAYWKPGEKEPWLLATNLPSQKATLRAYRRRMWVDEMFGDFKKHGFDLEKTHLRHFLRLSRLTLVAAWVYYWLVCLGSATLKNGRRRLVDRSDRRDLSIFRIGLNMLERRVGNGAPISFRGLPYFS
jgi:hypothetical protein